MIGRKLSLTRWLTRRLSLVQSRNAAVVSPSRRRHAAHYHNHARDRARHSPMSAHRARSWPAFRCASHHSLGLSASLPDLVGSPLEINMDNVLTIEELRQHLGSCFTCGVSWTDDHVSLDCSECGGYSLERPCPLCDGQCGVQWKRDFAMSHACSKARWVGVCLSFPEAMAAAVQQLPVASNTATTATSCAAAAAAAHQLRLAQELCSRLEQLSTASSTAPNKMTRL